MSGGHFNYKQGAIADIEDGIEQLIRENNREDEYGYKAEYSEEVLAKFREALVHLAAARIYTQRIDWLVSGDDGVDSFFERLEKELEDVTG